MPSGHAYFAHSPGLANVQSSCSLPKMVPKWQHSMAPWLKMATFLGYFATMVPSKWQHFPFKMETFWSLVVFDSNLGAIFGSKVKTRSAPLQMPWRNVRGPNWKMVITWSQRPFMAILVNSRRVWSTTCVWSPVVSES